MDAEDESEAVIGIISPADARAILANQLEIYRHAQNQAHTLVRTVLAGVAILAALSSNRILNYILGFSLSRTGPSIVAAPENIEQLTTTTGKEAFIFLLLASISFVFLSLQFAFKVLSTPDLRPALGGANRVRLGIERTAQNSDSGAAVTLTPYHQWIDENNRTLNELRYYQQNSYSRLHSGLIVGTYGILLYLVGNSGWADFTLLMFVFIFLLPFLVLILTGGDLGSLVGWWSREDSYIALPVLFVSLLSTYVISAIVTVNWVLELVL